MAFSLCSARLLLEPCAPADAFVIALKTRDHSARWTHHKLRLLLAKWKLVRGEPVDRCLHCCQFPVSRRYSVHEDVRGVNMIGNTSADMLCSSERGNYRWSGPVSVAREGMRRSTRNRRASTHCVPTASQLQRTGLGLGMSSLPTLR